MILIQSILNGNQAAQKIIYNKYKKTVSDFIRSKYTHCGDIDDYISEIMIKVFLNLKKFDETKSKFKTWVLSITKNYMIDKWRCDEVSFTSYSNEELVSDTQTINSDYYTSNNTDFENDKSINFISTKLTPSEFILLDMKYLQGYDYNEIGQEFNLTSSTVSNKVNYIKTKLKRNYTELIED